MFVDLFTLHRRAKQGLCLSISTPTADHYQCERENYKGLCILSHRLSCMQLTRKPCTYPRSHTRTIKHVLCRHADQVVPCMCCTVYSQLTCPLSNPDNLFGIGLLSNRFFLFCISHRQCSFLWSAMRVSIFVMKSSTLLYTTYLVYIV